MYRIYRTMNLEIYDWFLHTSSVLYIAIPTPPPGKLNTSCVSPGEPSDGVNESSNLPGLVITMSVERYWNSKIQIEHQTSQNRMLTWQSTSKRQTVGDGKWEMQAMGVSQQLLYTPLKDTLSTSTFTSTNLALKIFRRKRPKPDGGQSALQHSRFLKHKTFYSDFSLLVYASDRADPR